MQTRLAVLLFTDIVGSTAIKQRLGDRGYAPVKRQHDAAIAEAIHTTAEPTGSEAMGAGAAVRNSAGDSYLYEFATLSAAVRAAVAIHHHLRQVSWAAAGLDEPLAVRIGIHQGEIHSTSDLSEARQLSGLAVDLTARLMGLAAGGQTLVTRAVFDAARQYVRTADVPGGSADRPLAWRAHGPYLLKGLVDPLEVCEVGIEGIAPLAAPGESTKAKPVMPASSDKMLGWRPAVGEPVPRREGFRLARKLGEGGFGEVWLAEHLKTRSQRVVKFCFDADRLRSFKRELGLFRLMQQELGSRDDIARIMDIQLEEPPYFLESEFTPEGSLADWADREPAALPAMRLDVRLEMLARIADAAQAAHSVDIMHKDIKPSNVLLYRVDGELRPRLADFGIGFLANRSRLAAAGITATGFTEVTLLGSDSSRTGTRIYQPPEALMDRPFTPTGDVFALGVLAYQLVIGDLRQPLAYGWERAVRRLHGGGGDGASAARGRAARADARDAALAGAESAGDMARHRCDVLIATIDRLVDGDPAQRVPTAAEAARLLRSVESRAVAARDAETARLTALARAAARRVRGRAMAAVAAVLSVAGLVIAGLLWSNAAIAHERDLAEQARQQAETARVAESAALAAEAAARVEALKQRDAAVEAQAAAQRAADIATQVSGFLTGMFDSINPEDAQGRDILVREVLDANVTRLREAKIDSAETKLNLLNTLQNVYGKLGQAQTALDLATSALDLADQTYGEADHALVALGRNQVAYCLQLLGRPAEALPKYEAALAMNQRLFEADRPVVAMSLNNVAYCLQALGREAEALSKYEAALAMNQRMFPGDHPALATNLNNVAYCLSALGREAEALPRYEAALAMRQRLFRGDHPDVGLSLHNVAYSLKRLDRPAEALDYARRAAAMAGRCLPYAHPWRVNFAHRAASLMLQAGLDEEAAAVAGEHGLDIATVRDGVARAASGPASQPTTEPVSPPAGR